jgi:hypothetical protein
MATCPNKNLDSWKELVARHPRHAFFLWDKYEGNVPEDVVTLQAPPSLIEKTKEAAKKMGVSMMEMSEYAKESGLDTTDVNGLADLTRGVIAIAEGKEGVALTEEMVHIATAILEQTNPQLITDMISRIGNYKIYKTTYDQYSGKKGYQLPNGKPDIRKIKKEALDKLITEVIINQNQNIDSFPELKNDANQSLVQIFWNAIKDFIKSLYRKSDVRIFNDVASIIIAGEVNGTVGDIVGEGVYYNLMTDAQKDALDKITRVQGNLNKVVSDEPIDPALADSEEASNYYEYKQPDGTFKRVAKRVTDRVKAWYRDRFGEKKFTEYEKMFNEMKRDFGIKGHRDLELIHDRYYNKDGTKKGTPDPIPPKFGVENREMYDKLEKYYVDTIKRITKNDKPGQETLVFSEVMIYDEKEGEAGTIDFLAIEPSGKAHILDWKFMYIAEKETDVPWFKQGAYNVQLGRYKEILREQYGIKEFGNIRAVPFLMRFQFKKDNDRPILTGLAVGSADPTQIENMKLMPVSEETETTGNESLDEVLSKLNALVRQLEKKTPSDEEERAIKRQRTDAIRRAIRAAQASQNISDLIDVIETTRKEGDRILNNYDLIYKDRPATSQDSTNSELSDFAEDMDDYIKTSELFQNISRDIGDLIWTPEIQKSALSKDQKAEAAARKEILDKLRDESDKIYKSKDAIQKAAMKFADKHIGQRNLVTGLTKAEAVVKGLGSLFRGVSDLPLRSLQILYKLTRSAQGRASEDSLEEVKELMAIRQRIVDKGEDTRKYIQQIYQKTEKGGLVNKLIYKYSKEFFNELKKKAEAGGDMAWLKDNVDLDAYRIEAKEVIDRRIKQIEDSTTYAGSEEEVEEKKAYDILKVINQFNVDAEGFDGWNNYILKRHPKEEWESAEYSKIKNDPDLLALYNFISKINEKSKNVGFLSNQVSSTFLPFVRKSTAERLVWDRKLSPMKTFYNSLQINPDDVGYGKTNELTGELENAIPKYYTTDFTSDNPNDFTEVSEDLFKNMILYLQQVNKYKYLSEVESQLKLVKSIEQFKGHLNTGRTGNVIRKDGKVEELIGNEENTKMYDDFLRVLLYDQKYVLSDSDTPLHIDKVLNFVKSGVNKLAKREVFKENEKPTATSLMKTIDAANRAFQLKTLGFEFISGAVNAFGGQVQMSAQAGNYFKAREFVKNEGKILKQRFSNEEDRKTFIELMNVFMPMKDDPSYDEFNKAGLSVMTRENMGDILMFFMRKPEQIIEKSIFLTLLDNSMVEDGRIVNINEFVKAKYKDRYKSASEYRDSKEKIDSEIEQLKKTRSITVTKKMEDGKLVIPGLDLNNSTEIQRLTNLTRRISRNATGGMSDGDINRMSMSIWTKSMMIFKNWIPKLADTRFSEFRKVSDDFSVTIDEDGISQGEKFDIGRLRLLMYVLGTSIQDKSTNLLNIMAMNDAGVDKLQQYYEDFAKKYEEETGEKMTMDKDQFIDMIRTNIRNQIKELAILLALFGIMLSLGFMAPDDDADKATKNFHRYSEKVVDKFVGELSFFYNPAEFQNILSGGMFPAIGIVADTGRFIKHFTMETTGMDLDPKTSYDDVRKKAQPIKYLMKMAPVTKSVVTYASILSSDFAEEFDVTIQKNNMR